MERAEQISIFINSLVSDIRLRPIHIALSTALCHVWIRSQFRQPYSVSRSQLMRACRIHSKATYHKTLRELQSFGYLEYTPSYHPTNGIEQFKVMLLNRANRVLGIFEVSSGSSTGTIADPKLIFAAAIKANACGIIMTHNHPSGNLNPSQADIDLTKRVKEGGKFLEIQVLDHVILTAEGYYSFGDVGLL